MEALKRFWPAVVAAVVLVLIFIFIMAAYAQQVTQQVSSFLFITPSGQTLLGTASNGRDIIVGQHFGVSTTPLPIANACAGFTLAAGANDTYGNVTYTSATTCSVTFGRTYTQPPVCQAVAVNAVTPAVGSTTTTATGFAVTFAAVQTNFTYICFGS